MLVLPFHLIYIFRLKRQENRMLHLIIFVSYHCNLYDGSVLASFKNLSPLLLKVCDKACLYNSYCFKLTSVCMCLFQGRELKISIQSYSLKPLLDFCYHSFFWMYFGFLVCICLRTFIHNFIDSDKEKREAVK